MQPASKVIKQIREALALRGTGASVEALAGEYVRLAQEAATRLDSCVAMIGKGSEYQALQLAEAEPVLLDLLAILSFAEAREWAAFCAEQRLPVAPRFDARSVQALDALYAKGIRTDHPLYRDYRAAVSSRDDGRAIQIVRSIVRLNPQDANAKAELARLENKLFQLRLQRLRAALASRDESSILIELAELERLATPSKLAECTEFLQAAEVRRIAERTEAVSLAERLAASLPGEREAGAWRIVGEMLARLDALQAEHGFTLTPESATLVAGMRPYFEAERAAAAETARFQEAMNATTAQAVRIEARLLTSHSLTLEEADLMRTEFDRRWREVGDLSRAVPRELQQRAQAVSTALQSETARLQRARKIKVFTSIAAALLAVGVAAWFVMQAVLVRLITGELAGMQATGQVEAAETIIAQRRAGRTGLAAHPALRARLAITEKWAGDERSRLAAIEERLADLDRIALGNFKTTEPVETLGQLENVAHLTDELAADLRAGPSDRLAQLRTRFDAFLNSAREKVTAESERDLAAMEEVAGAKLGYDRTKETLLAATEQLGPRLKAIEARAQSPLAALALPPPLIARAAALRERVDLFDGELKLLQKIHEELLLAATLDAYRQALGGFKDSRLTQVAEVNAARKMSAAFPKDDDILAALVLPGDAAGWAAAKADQGGDLLAPADVLPAEISRLLALRDDVYLNDIWDVTLVDYSKKNERRAVYARGEIRKDGPRDTNGAQVTTWTGAMFDPAIKSDIPGFAPTTLTSQRSSFGLGGSGEVGESRRSAVSECLARLELNRMTDGNGEKFERPLLRVFDDLVREKTASPVFKAHLMQQLAAIVRERPFAWGMQYCPRLSRDLARLDELCGGETVRSMDWLLERKRTQFTPRVAPFFAELQSRTYLADARLHREIVRAAVQAGLQFGGFFDGTGRAHILGEAAAAGSLCALAADGHGVVRCDARTDEPTEKFAKFSPIYFVPVNRQAVLDAAARKIGGKLSPPEIPLFAAP